MYEIKEIHGNLFTCPKNVSLAHCVSRDFYMGGGIAVDFKKTFGNVQKLKNQNCNVGNVAVLDENERFIYYLVTKENYWDKPTYMNLSHSLLSMKNHALKNNISKIAMPRIGCGIDGLSWPKVRIILRDIFQSTDIEINVYYLQGTR